MVLNTKPDKDSARFILGIGIIAASIYAFYVGTAMRNSPELFLKPESMTIEGIPCTSVGSDGLSVCIPEGVEYSLKGRRIEFYSAEKKIRGSLEIIQGIPQERNWRASMKSPFIRMFIGNVDDKGTSELMITILQYRYNPTLMGAKAAIIPSWMKRREGARIIMLNDIRGLVFYTPVQSLGLLFKDGEIVKMSLTGRMTPQRTAFIIRSIRFTSPARPKTVSTDSS